MLLSNLTQGRDNNFNLIRFIAASLVLVSHSFPIAQGPGTYYPLGELLNTHWGAIAVDVFFIASGFFIAASFNYKSSLTSFVMARTLRIFPALILMTILTVLILGPVFTSYTLADYFNHTQTLKYLLSNTTLVSGIEYQLPGVFSDNPYKETVNGSLWTLIYEIKMYLLLAIFLSVLAYFKKSIKIIPHIDKTLFIILILIALCLHLANHFLGFQKGEGLKLFTMFFMGSLYFILKDKIPINSKIGITLILILLLSVINKNAFFVVYTLTLSYIVFYIAYIPKGKIRNFNKLGDYSYGIYIYAFPIQQMVANLSPGCSALELMTLSYIGTLIMSILSWHIIEERCISMKNRFK